MIGLCNKWRKYLLYLFEYNSRQLRREREKKKGRERERKRERERESWRERARDYLVGECEEGSVGPRVNHFKIHICLKLTFTLSLWAIKNTSYEIIIIVHKLFACILSNFGNCLYGNLGFVIFIEASFPFILALKIIECWAMVYIWVPKYIEQGK